MSNIQINPYAFAAAGGLGSWKELDRITLGSTTSPITVSSLPDREYYMILSNVVPNGVRAAAVRRLGYGSVDTGSNYASIRSDNGSSVLTNPNSNVAALVNLGTDITPQFAVDYCSNLSSEEKLGLSAVVLQNTAGSGNAPQRANSSWKWVNTSNPLDTYEITREPSETGEWLAGSECIVLGWDSTDTHTTADNFWQELGSATADGSSDTLSTSFTSKKYLWVQGYAENTAGSVVLRVGNTTLDSGNNYAARLSSNGGAEDVTTGIDAFSGLTSTTPIFWNFFIINNTANEKLAIGNNTRQMTAGSGTVPNKIEGVYKWANTSAQIDIVGFVSTTGGSTINSNSIIKVWGSD
tara:strand:- start:523 stop:1578 length:1056 start_codon:yes stop_codon:yes gene_type:complete